MIPIYEWDDALIGQRATDGSRTGIITGKCKSCPGASPCGIIYLKPDNDPNGVVELIIHTLSLLRPIKSMPLPLPG